MVNALPPSEPPGQPRPSQDPLPSRQLHPLPRGLVELYGLLAVLFVLVPEWMAGSALFGFRDGREGSDLPVPSGPGGACQSCDWPRWNWPSSVVWGSNNACRDTHD
jgi:hypothetical protein